MLTRRRIFTGLTIIILLPIVYLGYSVSVLYLSFLIPVGFRPTMPEQVVVFVLGIPIYFLPAILGRRKRNARALFVLNLLLGWTFLGWVGALIWALLRDSAPVEPDVS